MRIERELEGLTAAVSAWKAGGQRIALVPTMGALHDGHLALIAAARAEADRVITSIFVNPLQFAANEDLDRYPRDEAGDLEKLRQAGCDLVWLPSPAAMYPAEAATLVDVRGPAEGWEGAARPGHFRGVATVCTKLFMMTRADLAAFGEKDWQQLQVIQRLVVDLHLPLRILPVPTRRDMDGLALSSRNIRLSPEERQGAAWLPLTLERLAGTLAAGETGEDAVTDARRVLEAQGFRIDYVALVEPASLKPWVTGKSGPARLIAAAQLGDVRLLDNWPVTIPSPKAG